MLYCLYNIRRESKRSCLFLHTIAFSLRTGLEYKRYTGARRRREVRPVQSIGLSGGREVSEGLAVSILNGMWFR